MNTLNVKMLTKSQEKKADKIVALLRELKKDGVHPMVIDGGGGDGLSFVRCPAKDRWDFGMMILSNEQEIRKSAEQFIYRPNKSWEVTIDYITP